MSEGTQPTEYIDIFISYCHGDNEPFPTPEDPCWVTELHDILAKRLNQIRGKQCEIFRDPKLSGVDEKLSEALKTRIEKTRFLLVITSPLYLNSKYCKEERETFVDKHGPEQGPRRIIRVDKILVPPPPLPKELNDKLAYVFFRIDPETKHSLEISLRGDKDSVWRFQTLINDLAYHITAALSTPANTSKQNTIYLAETSPDTEEHRQEIRRELSQRRYNILPDIPLSMSPSKARALVKKQLKQSFLSIHIVGNEYEPMQQHEGNQSIVELQFHEASRNCHKNKFDALVWMPKGLKPKDTKQSKLIETIGKDQNISDLMVSTIEDFKTEISARIKLIKAEDKEKKNAQGVSIYLYCSKEDFGNESRGKATNHISDIKKYLYYEGYDVLMPDYLDSESETKKIHKDNLEDCNAILIYFGASNKKWNRDSERELRKHPNFERKEPLQARCIYVEKDLEPPAIQVATLVHGKALFSNDSLKPFLQNLESKKSL